MSLRGCRNSGLRCVQAGLLVAKNQDGQRSSVSIFGGSNVTAGTTANSGSAGLSARAGQNTDGKLPEARYAGSPCSVAEPVRDAYVAVVALLLIVIGLAGWRYSGSWFTSPQAGAPVGTVDPNAAPWWELTVLPRVGEVTARTIVTYRESAGGGTSIARALPVFRRPADLARVRGIGPKTVTRIAPYLRFDLR